jgi:hypothetical protein
MGNYVLYQSLVHRSKSGQMTIDAATKAFSLLRTVVFAGPDLARKDMDRVLDELQAFASQHAVSMPNLTLYCSRRDWALAMSAVVRRAGNDKQGRVGFYWRKHKFLLGWSGHHIHPYLCQKMQTVDVTGTNRDCYHSCFSLASSTMHST